MSEARPPAADPPSTTSKSMTSGSLWAFGVALLSPAYTFTTSVAIARFLGAADLGRITFIAFVRETLTMVLLFGLPQALMRYVGETVGSGRAGRLRSLYRTATVVSVAAAGVGFASLAAVGLFWRDPRWAWVLAGAGAALAILHNLPSTFLIGVQRWRDAYVMGLATGAIAVVGKLAVLGGHGGIAALFAVDACASLITLVGTVLLALRAARLLLPEAEPAGELKRNTFRFASIASLSTFIRFVVYRRTELFFLERFSTPTQIAYYSVPFSLVDTLILLPRTVGTVIAPAVATMYGAGDHDRIRSGYARSLRILLPLTLFATGGSVILGPTLMRLLYGPDFRHADWVLVILLITLPFVPLQAVSGSLLLGIGKQWVPTAIIAVAAIVNIGLDFALIRPFHAVGAAIANSSAQVVASVPSIVYAAVCVGGVSLAFGYVVRSVGAAGLATLVAWSADRSLPGVWGLLAGIAAFVAVAVPVGILFRVLESDDAAWFEASLPAGLARPVSRVARVIDASLHPVPTRR